MLSLVLLVSPTLALAQVPPAQPLEPATTESEPAPETEPAPESEVQTDPAAETAPAVEAAPAAEAAPAPEPAPATEAELPPEEPKMKRVCRQVEVVGSAIGRTVCTMKPVRAPKPKGE
jgi:hypothetical protein